MVLMRGLRGEAPLDGLSVACGIAAAVVASKRGGKTTQTGQTLSFLRPASRMRNVLSSRRASSSDLLIVTVSCCVGEDEDDDKREETCQRVLLLWLL